MNDQLSRRGLLVGAAALVCGGRAALAAVENAGAASEGRVTGPNAERVALVAGEAGAGAGASQAQRVGAKRLAALEKREGGRLGVEAWDTGSGKRIQHRSGERFGMCSVFKFLAAGAILKRVDEGTEHLERRIEFGASDLLEYAPVAKEHVKDGALTLGEACAAAVQWSDNTAANMVLKVLAARRLSPRLSVLPAIRSRGWTISSRP